MQRREVIWLLGGAGAWPLVANIPAGRLSGGDHRKLGYRDAG